MLPLIIIILIVLFSPEIYATHKNLSKILYVSGDLKSTKIPTPSDKDAMKDLEVEEKPNEPLDEEMANAEAESLLSTINNEK